MTFYLLNRIEEPPLIIPNFKPELWIRPSSLNISHEILKFSFQIKELQLPVQFRICQHVTSLVYHLKPWIYVDIGPFFKHGERRLRSLAFMLRKQQLWRRQNTSRRREQTIWPMAVSVWTTCSRKHHMQQQTDLLTIAVIRKRHQWTANMAVAWIV